MSARGLCLLAVFAHPDDESFGPSATLAKYARGGVEVHLVCATRGEAGEISDPALATPENLGAVREKELRCAAKVIGIKEVRFLGYPDGGLAKCDQAEVESGVVRAVRELKPQVMVTFGPDGISGHLDHITIGRIATSAFSSAGDRDRFPEQMKGLLPHEPQKLYYVALPQSLVRGMGFDLAGTPDDKITTRIDTAAFTAVKREAIMCHRTQLSDEGRIAPLPEEVLKEWFSGEYFTLAESRVSPSEGMEDDLFRGLG